MTAQIGNYAVRDIAPWDAQAVHRMTGDPRTVKYVGIPLQKHWEETAALIERWNASPTKFQAVTPADDPTDILGVVAFEVRNHHTTLTIMFRDDWKAHGAGRGFSLPFVKWIFTHPQVWRVSAFCHIDNVPVQRVLERMGALREGRLRRFEFFPNVSTEEPQDVYVYSITRG